MLKTTKVKSINGASYVTEEDRQVQVVSMSASVNDSGNESMNITVINSSLYNLYTEEAMKDIEEFKKLAAKLNEA